MIPNAYFIHVRDAGWICLLHREDRLCRGKRGKISPMLPFLPVGPLGIFYGAGAIGGGFKIHLETQFFLISL